MGECQTEDLEVAGSSPARGTHGEIMTRRALYEKKKRDVEKKVRLVLLVRFSQLAATVLMVIGILVLIILVYLKYYS